MNSGVHLPGLMGTMMAGAAFLALDPSYPVARLRTTNDMSMCIIRAATATRSQHSEHDETSNARAHMFTCFKLRTGWQTGGVVWA